MDTEKIIIDEYLNHQKSISQLSREYNLPYCRIQKILRDNKITIRGGRKKKSATLTLEQLQLIETMYKEGKLLKEIGKQVNLHYSTVSNIIKENNFTRPNNNRVNKRIKSDYFSKIDSQEKAYWLGFLFTDGSVDHYGPTGRVRIQLQKEDREILEKYKECLGLDCKIIEDNRYKSGLCSVEFTDEQIFDDLVNFGIIPNKTYECHHIPYEKIPSNFLIAFIRGLYDGDGGLSMSEDCSTDVTLGFTSYYESVVQDFQTLVDNLINKSNHNKNFFTSAWHTQWRGRLQVLSILDILYKDSTIHLNRKYQKYKKLKESLN